MRMQNSGIIIDAPPKRVSFFLRAGYRILDEVPAEETLAEEEVEEEAEAPVEDTAEEEAEKEEKEGGK